MQKDELINIIFRQYKNSLLSTYFNSKRRSRVSCSVLFSSCSLYLPMSFPECCQMAKELKVIIKINCI